ncbi:MAG: hypothetical protein ACREVH_07915 [Gammaproteobacteria bacterium]
MDHRRLHSQGLGRGGHGIGVAVVREIVEQVYGGTLEFGRAERGGALVLVRL